MLFESCMPEMQVGFCLSFRILVTDPQRVYTAKKNFVALAEYLDQNAISVFCDGACIQISAQHIPQKAE